MDLLPISFKGCLASLTVAALVASTAIAADAPKPAEKPAEKSEKQETKPAKSSAKGQLSPELSQAVEALTAEFEPIMKDPTSSATVRLKSDYFGKDSTVTVSQADLLAALNKKLHKDPRVDAYILSLIHI